MPEEYERPIYGQGKYLEAVRQDVRGAPSGLPKAPRMRPQESLRPAPSISDTSSMGPHPIAPITNIEKEAVERAIILSSLAEKYPSRELIELAHVALEEAEMITGAEIGLLSEANKSNKWEPEAGTTGKPEGEKSSDSGKSTS